MVAYRSGIRCALPLPARTTTVVAGRSVGVSLLGNTSLGPLLPVRAQARSAHNPVVRRPAPVKVSTGAYCHSRYRTGQRPQEPVGQVTLVDL